MANRKKSKRKEETIVDIVEAKQQAQTFVERNQYLVIGVIAAFVIIVGGYLSYRYLYQAPREVRAMGQMYSAENQFKRDSFALALENPGGGFEGFLDIIDNYSGTKAANTAKYYAGISYLNLGRYEAAVDFLKDFKAKGDISPIMKFGAMGDAYSELNDFDNAIKNYRKASKVKENDFLTPYYLKKLGLLLERQGDVNGAREALSEIKEKYPLSSEAQTIESDLVRLGT